MVRHWVVRSYTRLNTINITVLRSPGSMTNSNNNEGKMNYLEHYYRWSQSFVCFQQNTHISVSSDADGSDGTLMTWKALPTKYSFRKLVFGFLPGWGVGLGSVMRDALYLPDLETRSMVTGTTGWPRHRVMLLLRVTICQLLLSCSKPARLITTDNETAFLCDFYTDFEAPH